MRRSHRKKQMIRNFWNKIYPSVKRILVVGVCIVIIASNIRPALQVRADETEVISAAEVFPDSEQEDVIVEEPISEPEEAVEVEEPVSEVETGENEETEEQTATETEAVPETDKMLLEECTTEEIFTEEVLTEEATTEEAFDEKEIIDNIEVCVEADPGVFPIGAELKVRKIENKDEEIAQVIGEQTKTEDVKTLAVFDITINVDGEEVQPDTEKGEVKVTFNHIDTSVEKNSNAEIQVFHVEDDYSAADAVDTSVHDEEVSFAAEHFSLYVVALKGEAVVAPEIDAKEMIDSVALTKQSGEVITTSHGEMNQTDVYKVVYNLKNNISFTNTGAFLEGEDYYYLEYGKEYELPGIPPVFDIQQVSGSLTWVAEAEADGKRFKFADVIAAVDGTLTLKVLSSSDMAAEWASKGLSADDAEVITDVALGVNIKLNMTAVGVAETLSFVLGDPGTSYTVTVTDNEKAAPTIDKKVVSSDAATGTINWQVTVTNPRNPELYGGVTFTDTISNNQSYKKNSFKKNGVRQLIENDTASSSEKK